jgi:hypothetical protein
MRIEEDNDEGCIELEGKHMFVVRDGIRIAKRVNGKWVSLIHGVTVRDIKGRGNLHEIEIIYSGVTH